MKTFLDILVRGFYGMPLAVAEQYFSDDNKGSSGQAPRYYQELA